MSSVALPASGVIEYPYQDDIPLADSTLQFDWLEMLFAGLEAQYRDAVDVMVASNNLWYPVEGDPRTSAAPDIMVVFGRPKQTRKSYLQWKELGIGPQVTMEIRSPSNSTKDLKKCFDFYQRFGVEEYYLIDPWKDTLDGWTRVGKKLKKIAKMNGWVSSRLGIRFELRKDWLHIIGADGQEFLMIRERARQQEKAKEESRRVTEKLEAERKKLAAKLRELGVDPDKL
jgi:Uma2 family endonuclease